MAEASPPPQLSRGKLIAFSAIAMLLPFALVGVIEVGLRATGYGREQALFIPASFDSARYLVPNPRFARRYFPGDPSPPTPPSDAFLRAKPQAAFRLIVLGESTTAGFPYPANGTFSRVLGDALRDVLSVPVEVINVGIPATNSYAILDELPEVIAQHPDVVLIYAGHNEYYGALGAASTVRLGGNPALVRFVLRLRRWRVVMLAQRAIDAARGSRQAAPAAGVSRMEELAARDTLRLGSAAYQRGIDQFRENLVLALRELRAAGIPAYVGSLASNLRDQAPFASDTGSVATNASAAFAAAHVALSARDPAAESLFTTARDLDLIRFRAPTRFNDVIRAAAAAESATYVPVAETFRAAAADHVPGNELFFEHVHPRPPGVTLIAEAFFRALASHGFHDRTPDVSLIGDWRLYTSRMELTAVDSQIATTIVEALKHRWPFVRRETGTNYLETYVPRNATDSAALAVVTGRATWVQAKLVEAARFEKAGDFPRAIAEYRGLMRDQPWNESPYRFAARAYMAMNRGAEAKPLLERAYALEPTPFTCFALAQIVAADSTQLPRAAALLQQSLQIGGYNPNALYQLSLVEARLGNVRGAQAAAAALYRATPNYPGLREWMQLLKMR